MTPLSELLTLLGACIVVFSGAWALVKFVAYDTLIAEISLQRTETEKLREICETNIARINKLNEEVDLWQRKYYELHEEHTLLQSKYDVLSGKHEMLQREFDRMQKV